MTGTGADGLFESNESLQHESTVRVLPPITRLRTSR